LYLTFEKNHFCPEQVTPTNKRRMLIRLKDKGRLRVKLTCQITMKTGEQADRKENISLQVDG
jgi:hypothetical protein